MIRRPHFEKLQEDLRSTQRRLADWGQELGITRLHEIETRIPPEDYKEVEQLFQTATDNVDKAYKKYSPSEKASRQGIHTVKVTYYPSDIRDLEYLAGILRALVLRSNQICPPLPKLDSIHLNPVVSMTSDLRTSAAASPSRDAVGPVSGTDDAVQMPEVGFTNLYEGCLMALSFIAARMKNTPEGKRTENARSRLQTWTKGVVRGPRSLDQLVQTMDDHDGSIKRLRECAIMLLVDIALVADEFLRRLSASSSEADREKIEELQVKLIKATGAKGIDDIAAERPLPTFTDDEDGSIEEKAVLELHDVIDGLNFLLIGIRSLRHDHRLLKQLSEEEHASES